MSELIPSKEFDQWSSFSFKSHLSNMEFTSPLPLPPQTDQIPTNNQIGQTYQEIEQHLPDVDTDHLVSVLYKNVISPKIKKEKALSEASAVSNGSQISRISMISNITRLNSSTIPFKIHPNQSQFSLVSKNQDDQLEGQAKKKKKRRLKKENKIRQLPQYKHNFKGQNQDNLKKAQAWKAQDNKQHHLFSKAAPQFQNKQDQVKYEQKKLVARCFCQRGYGFDKLKEEVWEAKREVLQMQKKRFQVICSAFVTQSYRKLEHFLIQDCQRNIKNLTSPEMRALIPILLASQLKFEEEDHLTWRKFIKVTYDLGSVSIFQQMAVKLYIKIQICLRGRIGTLKLDRQYRQESSMRQMLRSPGRFLNQRLQVQSAWTKELQFQFLDILLQEKTIAKTRDRLRVKYKDIASFSSVKELKARFFRILRITVKRLLKYIEKDKDNLPHMVTFDDDKVKVMVRHPVAKPCRWAIARLYRTEGQDRNILLDVIEKVNEFCYFQQTRKDGNHNKEPVINSVNDKIKHNIKVSRRLLKSVTTPLQRAGSQTEAVFLKQSKANYQHIVSLQHNDKLHYFRKTGVLNSKGGFEYEEKPPELRKLQLQDGDDDSEQLVYLSDQDCESDEQEQNDYSQQDS